MLSEYHIANGMDSFSYKAVNTYDPSQLISNFSSSILHTWIETSQTVFNKSRIVFGTPIEVCHACVKSLYYAWALHKSLPSSEYLKNYNKKTLRHFLLYFPYGQGLQADEKVGTILLSMNVFMTQLLHQLYPNELSLVLPYLQSLFHTRTKLSLSTEQLELLSTTLEKLFINEPGFLDSFLKWIQMLHPDQPVKSFAIQFFISFLKKSESHYVVTIELLQVFCLDLMDSLCSMEKPHESLVRDTLSFFKFVFCSYSLQKTFLEAFALKLTPFFNKSESDNDTYPFLNISSNLQCLFIDFLYYLDFETFSSAFRAFQICLKVSYLSHETRSRAFHILGIKETINI